MKRLLIIIAALVPFQTADAQDRADRQQLTDPASSSMILFGDPQGYVKYDINQPIFELTTLWVADNIDQLNIKAVLCTGDMVEQNENNALNRHTLNQSSTQMWESISRSLQRIDNKVPFICCGGNHEYGFRRSESYITNYPKYITFERNSTYADCLKKEFPNRNGHASLENAAFEFEMPGWSHKILVISSEFAPSAQAVEWVRELVTSDDYKDHYVIYLTHSYLREKSAEYTHNEGYWITQQEGNHSGKMLWENLISKVPNIRLVICGHTGRPSYSDDVNADYELSTAYRVDKNASGKKVHQMMFNVQTLGGGWEGNGGDGWLRILEFIPDGKTIKVRTYSPLFGISPSTRHLSHRTAPYDQFDMVID
ncbi:MAG: metallophosphoesterase [Bacteroidales bacterium]|nr:metallophosphoesterase [Bacteroidales bacterium]